MRENYEGRVEVRNDPNYHTRQYVAQRLGGSPLTAAAHRTRISEPCGSRHTTGTQEFAALDVRNDPSREAGAQRDGGDRTHTFRTASTRRRQSDPLQHRDSQSNAALEITQQPPETWYKDQYGRKATFELKVTRTEISCAKCVEQRILTVQLLYESGKVVEKQEILHVTSGQCLDKNRQSKLAIRIAEVSKNHLNQRFRVEIAVPRCVGDCDYEMSVVSNPVLVLSKKKKRPVKQNAETESSANAKKARRASVQDTPKRKMSSDSPSSSQSSTATITSNVTAAIAEWKSRSTARSGNDSSVHTRDTKLMFVGERSWQRVPTSGTEKPEILAQALSKAYKCPSCQETYGQIPMHRDDCDLKLLLEQGGKTEMSTTGTDKNLTAPHSLQWSSDKHMEWQDRPEAMYSGGDTTPKMQTSPYNLSQDIQKLSEPGSGATQTPADVLTRGRTMHRYPSYFTGTHFIYGLQVTASKCCTSPYCAMDRGTAASRHTFTWLSHSPSAMKNHAAQQAGIQQSMPSQRFSALLAVTKGMPADAADLFRESEAALHGDGSIVSSMNSMNLSDFLRPSPGDKSGNDQQLRHGPISLSALLPSDQLGNPEKGVQIIMAYNFQGCGLPALDASFNLVGFYHVLTATHNSPAELRFGPHLFPLPEEMLQELKTTIAEWRHNSSIYHQREPTESNPEEALAHMKSAVLQQVTR
ncbi:hypothetical protein GQ600_13962 [Phytophthora cactorum]|nr:hypothetical protein GQ600_13962 [Phytophthora cactorum]